MSENTTTNTNPTSEQIRNAANSAADRARDLYSKGSARTVIFRKADGSKLFEMNLAVTVIAAIALFMFAGWLLVLSVIAGFLMKIRIEVIGEINDNATIQMEDE